MSQAKLLKNGVAVADANGHINAVSVSALAAQIGATLGLGAVKTVSDGSDWDTLTTAGYYLISGNDHDNSPDNLVSRSIMLVTPAIANSFAQILLHTQKNLIFTRTQFNGAWKSWKQISATEVVKNAQPVGGVNYYPSTICKISQKGGVRHEHSESSNRSDVKGSAAKCADRQRPVFKQRFERPDTTGRIQDFRLRELPFRTLAIRRDRGVRRAGLFNPAIQQLHPSGVCDEKKSLFNGVRVDGVASLQADLARKEVAA